MVCVFCRRNGYVYQYSEAIEQSIEGSLEIVTTVQQTGVKSEVIGGICQDFFEIRSVNRINESNCHWIKNTHAFTCITFHGGYYASTNSLKATSNVVAMQLTMICVILCH